MSGFSIKMTAYMMREIMLNFSRMMYLKNEKRMKECMGAC